MKKLTSIKTRITIWYSSLMLILIAIVLTLVWILSYRLSIENIEKDITLRVTQVSERVGMHRIDVFHMVDNDEEFKNVSIYGADGGYITGQYIYDVANIEFKDGKPRREKVDGREYIVYDMFRRGMPGERGGFWVRGAESVSSTMVLGRSAVVIILIIIPLVLILAVLGGYYITKKAFLPISGIIKTANEISEQKDISRRIAINPDGKHDELHNLSVTLNKMLDRIEKLIRQEKQFTSDASHELRTPISVILAQGEYLADIAETEKERELAENIVDKANHISKLVSRLLLFARIDQNRQKFNKERVDIGVIADIAIDSTRELAERKNISVISEVPESVFAVADEELLLSAVTNLISNGIKYGRENGSVRITAQRDEKTTEIIVADNGIGIAEEHIDKIWDRFYRVDDVRNDEYSSSGLGLAMVKSIIALHGGEITVKSKVGEGTEFKIALNN